MGTCNCSGRKSNGGAPLERTDWASGLAAQPKGAIRYPGDGCATTSLEVSLLTCVIDLPHGNKWRSGWLLWGSNSCCAAIVSVGQNEQSTSGYLPGDHNVSDEWRAFELWIEEQQSSVVNLAPVHTAARKIIVVIGYKGLVQALYR